MASKVGDMYITRKYTDVANVNFSNLGQTLMVSWLLACLEFGLEGFG